MSDHGKEKTIEILVNEKSVTMTLHKATGLQIKEAAIAAGVNITLEHVLSQELNDRKSKAVGDTEEITLHPNMKFTAVAADDNS